MFLSFVVLLELTIKSFVDEMYPMIQYVLRH